ncbi:protein spinster homolog 3-like isoform X2 [Rhineura floridana]|uniref:protein spinster homolog 3-like isoform X2 n=1 Tax=Rhineura floridana TaxID=261503 RepID=UPI002AC80F62|nr:protein spinster homolog 3-like isoform X2 [Rhineura floridana]
MNQMAVPGVPPQSPLSLKAYGTIELNEQPLGARGSPTKRAYLAVAVLCYLNLVNYMDWFIVPGVLIDIQKYFTLRDSSAGLLHTVFVLCFLLAAPGFGYLGDRYNRKIILGAGIILWSGVTLGSSFIPESMDWLFFVSRGLVGAGTASYSTIAPTIIADLFEKDHRTWMLSLFYIFIPVGSGLGYILSSGMAAATGHWNWGFRVTPCMGAVGLVFLVLLVPESPRHGTENPVADECGGDSTWLKDISSLCKNWSFLWSSLGVTAMSFVIGALGFWMPVFLSRAQIVLDLVSPCQQEPCDTSNSRIFGGMTIATGILGVVVGAEAARRFKKINAMADPLICALGLLTSTPSMYLAIMLAQESIVATYIFIALGEFLLSLNWALVTDILLYVVKPTRQSTALALQIFVSHLLGDAGSPYLIGIISSVIQKNQAESSSFWSFRSLQYSFVLCIFIGVLGGGCFLLTALRIEEDRIKAAPPAPVQGTENKSYVLHEEELGGEPPAL